MLKHQTNEGEIAMKTILSISAVALVLTACATAETAGPSATAIIRPASGSQVHGEVTFTQIGADRVRVAGEIAGHGTGPKGFHIHEKGDCSAPDAMSAGGHFNPTGKPHGDPNATDHHAGDMPQLIADASGKATLTAELSPMTVGAGANDIIGKAVVVHKDADDFKTQPTGNSGGRVACGVITKS